MSQYFRCAIQCDRSIASTAPIEFYALDDDADEQRQSPSALLAHVDDSADGKAKPSMIDHFRAQQDDVEFAKIRLRQKRDAQVLLKEARRDAELRSRLKEIDDRTQSIIAEVAAMGKKRSEQQAEAEKQPQHLSAAGEVGLEEKGFLEAVAPQKKDVFECIRVEEMRQLRMHNHKKGIVGMYNDACLEIASKAADSSVRSSGKPFPSQLQPLDGVAAPSVPCDPAPLDTDVTKMVQSGAGASAFDSVRRRFTEYQRKIQSCHNALKEKESMESVQAAHHAAIVSAERGLMLRELKEQALHRSAKSAAAASALTVSAAANTSLRQQQEHPVDIYQRMIRDDLIAEAKEQADHKSAIIAERLDL